LPVLFARGRPGLGAPNSWVTKDIDHDRAARSLSVLNAQTLNGACVGVGSRTCLKGHGDAFPLKGVARAPGRA